MLRVIRTEICARPEYIYRENPIHDVFKLFCGFLVLEEFHKQINESVTEVNGFSTEQIFSSLSGMDYNVVIGTDTRRYTHQP